MPCEYPIGRNLKAVFTERSTRRIAVKVSFEFCGPSVDVIVRGVAGHGAPFHWPIRIVEADTWGTIEYPIEWPVAAGVTPEEVKTIDIWVALVDSTCPMNGTPAELQSHAILGPIKAGADTGNIEAFLPWVAAALAGFAISTIYVRSR